MRQINITWSAKALIVLLMATALINCGNGDDFRLGYVESDEIDVASRIPGRLIELRVKNGDKVKKDDIIAVLESDQIKARVEQARAGLDAAKAQLDMARNGSRVEEKRMARRQFNIAAANLELVERTYNRVLKVYKDGGVSDQEKDMAEFRWLIAKENYEKAKAFMDMVNNGARKEQIDALKANVRGMEEKVREAESAFGDSYVKAPKDAEIKQINAQTGEIITPGFPILSLLEPEKYVIFNLKEDEFAGLKVGDTLRAYIPALQKESELMVYYIAPMADFARYESTSEKGSWDVKTFEIRASFARSNEVDALRPGMSVKIFNTIK